LLRGENKTVFAFCQEHLPSQQVREELRVFFKGAMKEIERMVEWWGN
jgi:hypothetical protein